MDLRWKHSHVVGQGHPRGLKSLAHQNYPPHQKPRVLTGCTPRKVNSSPMKIGMLNLGVYLIWPYYCG